MFNKTSMQATFFVQPGLLPVLAIRMSTDLKHRSEPSFIFHIFQLSFLTFTKQQKIVCSRCFWTSGNTQCYLGEVAALRGCTGGNTGDALFVEVNAQLPTLCTSGNLTSQTLSWGGGRLTHSVEYLHSYIHL